MDAAVIVPVLIGVAGLAIGALCWRGPIERGPWRGWPEREAQVGIPYFSTSLFAGAFFVCLGLDNAFGGSTVFPALVVVTCFSLLFALVFGWWNPRWFGPRWYRELRHAFHKGEGGPCSWMVDDVLRPGERSVDATQRQSASDRPLPPTARVQLVVAPYEVPVEQSRYSLLLFYAQAPVLLVTAGTGGTKEDEVEEIVTAESLVEVRGLPSGGQPDGSVHKSGVASRFRKRVRIDTTEGPWVLEARHAKDVVREIQRRYMDESRNMYGMKPRGPTGVVAIAS